MGWDRAWDDLMGTNIKVYTVSTGSTAFATRYGVPGYSTTPASTHIARHMKKRHAIHGADGQQVAASGTIIFRSTSSTLAAMDKVELADGSFPPIVSVDTITDVDGPIGYRVTLGW